MNKILTICGGFSTEREIGLLTGQAVARGISIAGYESYFLDTAFPKKIFKADKDFKYAVQNKVENTADNVLELSKELVKFKPDKVFIGLHGGEGENGEIQALLHLLQIEYVGSDSKTSAICMDKNISKIIAKSLRIPTAKWSFIDENEYNKSALKKIIKPYGYPVVIKALSQGSSVGVSILHSENDIERTLKMMNAVKDEYFIEEYIKGRELSVPVIKGYAFSAIELIPNEGFYDYEHKYTPGVTTHVCPAKLNDKQVKTINSYAEKLYIAVGCRDFARIDFILSENGKFYFLEINTLPGMTELSLVPESARASGISFPELMNLLLNE
ncbi:MAG: D-alanine--D-alanine ligase [Candidatus Delongbacteria bacterium]|nr:D-alanine--D-alanine ligase [Candidatus Delongbacteria bacterium]MCG2761251.1 D-alanine--D-alanine ligase [Candidatus Delongbacteria bacterium]